MKSWIRKKNEHDIDLNPKNDRTFKRYAFCFLLLLLIIFMRSRAKNESNSPTILSDLIRNSPFESSVGLDIPIALTIRCVDFP